MVGQCVGSVGNCRAWTKQLSLATIVTGVVDERRSRKVNVR